MRIDASMYIVLGWIALCLCIIATFIPDKNVIFIVPILIGVASWCLMYLTACAIRAVATRTEAAQIYINNNTQEEKQYDE